MKGHQVLLLPQALHLILYLTVLALRVCLLAIFLVSQGLNQAFEFKSLALHAVSLQNLPARRIALLIPLSLKLFLAPHFQLALHFSPNKVQMVLYAIFVSETQNPIVAAPLWEKFCKQEERVYQIDIQVIILPYFDKQHFPGNNRCPV